MEASRRCRRDGWPWGASSATTPAEVELPAATEDVDESAREIAPDDLPAATFCRALNIPARYVFGYIPDINVPPPSEPMDFAAWFEAYLDGQWHTFDARNNRVRVGRVVVGRGRDAVDVALITSFGALTLTDFEVKADRLARPVPE